MLDRGGARALTIRAVARELGADPTALYRHFRDKAELLCVVGDRLLDDVGAPPPGAGWRPTLEQVAAELRAVLTRHRGGVELFAESAYTPAATRLVEQTVAQITARGLPPGLAGDAVRAVVALVFGHVAQLGPADEDGFWPELLDAARPRAGFPAIHAAAEGWVAEPEEQFERQLALLLDGVATRATSPT